MTNIPTTPPVSPSIRRRSSLRIFLPTLLLIAFCIAWSGYWWWASRQVERSVTAFIAHEAASGHQISCSDRQNGGYPFRFEIRCINPHLEITRGDGSAVASAQSFVAVAQAYYPQHVIIEIAGPLVVTAPDKARTLTLDWKSAEASLVATLGGEPERSDLVIEGLTASVDAPADGGTQMLFKDARVETHARVSEAPNAKPGDYDFAGSVAAAEAPPVDAILGGQYAIATQIQGTLTGLLDLPQGRLEEVLRAWAAAGGKLHFDTARIDRGPTSINANGDLSIDPDGHPAGRLYVSLAGVTELSKSLQEAGLAPAKLTSLLSIGLAMLGKPTNIDGKPAIEVPLTMSDGKAAIGSFPLPGGRLPRLF